MLKPNGLVQVPEVQEMSRCPPLAPCPAQALVRPSQRITLVISEESIALSRRDGQRLIRNHVSVPAGLLAGHVRWGMPDVPHRLGSGRDDVPGSGQIR